MSFLETIKSRGFLVFAGLLILIDILSPLVVSGFKSFVFLLVVELIAAFIYVVSRAVSNADEKSFIFKK